MPRLSPPAAPVDGIHLPTRRQTLGALALLTLLAVALRWPVSVFPELLPLDVNSQHHILMFDGTPPKSLGSACETFRNQVLAWPIWLLSRAAKLVWSPVGAFHVASLVWLVLQGASGWALGACARMVHRQALHGGGRAPVQRAGTAVPQHRPH